MLLCVQIVQIVHIDRTLCFQFWQLGVHGNLFWYEFVRHIRIICSTDWFKRSLILWDLCLNCCQLTFRILILEDLNLTAQCIHIRLHLIQKEVSLRFLCSHLFNLCEQNVECPILGQQIFFRMIERCYQLARDTMIICRQSIDLVIDINTHRFVQQRLSLCRTHTSKRCQVRSIYNELERILIYTQQLFD